MLILALTLRLRLNWCHSLKDKRQQSRSLMAKLRQRFNVSVAESGSQDLHNLLELTIIALAFDSAQGDSIGENLFAFVESNTEGEIVGWEAEYR